MSDKPSLSLSLRQGGGYRAANMKMINADGVRRIGLAGPQIPTPDAGVRGARRLFFLIIA
jgi:hypothetical protein